MSIRTLLESRLLHKTLCITEEKVMCRYAFNNYKQTWSCFKCRKSFKKTNLEDYLSQHGELEKYKKLAYSKKKSEKLAAEEKYQTTASNIEQDYYKKIAKCPECGSQMANMGMDFKSPKTTDEKSWKIIEGMFSIGAIYQTCGCEGFGFVPSSKSEYTKYLTEKLASYLARVRDVETDKELNSFERAERADYWSTRVNNVQNEIKNT